MNCVIDPGHGYKFFGRLPSGARGSGLVEDDVVFDARDPSNGFAQRLGHILRERGHEAILTRGKKYVTLERRAQIALNQGADALISLHCNWAMTPLARGVELYAVQGDLKGLNFAKGILGSLHTKLGRRMAYRNPSVKWDTQTHVRSLYILRHTYQKMRAVLIEIAFLTNTRDATLLTDRQFRQDFCEAVADAVTKL
jgi:N-acetylmuramoyl-L-alanine amidase